MRKSNPIKITLTEEKIRNAVRQRARDWFPELANAEVLPIEGKDVDTKYDKAIVNTARYDKYKGEVYIHIGGAFYPHGDRDEVEASINHGWVKCTDWKAELQKAIKELEAEVERVDKEIESRKKKEDLNENKDIPTPYNELADDNLSNLPDGEYEAKFWCHYFRTREDNKVYYVDKPQQTVRAKENQVEWKVYPVKDGIVRRDLMPRGNEGHRTVSEIPNGRYIAKAYGCYFKLKDTGEEFTSDKSDQGFPRCHEWQIPWEEFEVKDGYFKVV